MRAYVVTPGFEEALGAELGPVFARRATIVPGVVAADEPAADVEVDPVFARQALPDAAEVSGASVRALAEGAYAAVEAAIDRWTGPFVLHAFAPPAPPAADADTTLPAARLAHTRALATRREAPRGPAGRRDDAGLAGRASLVGQSLLQLLGERRKRASRRHAPDLGPEAFDARALLVQVLLVSRDRALASAAAPRALPHGGFDLAPWPAGAPPVADDPTPPSRAYKKLEEAFQWMGAAPRAGETCVDLGAAPGSWTYAAARRGAAVLAVDRSPLAPAVARLRGVTATTGNAFTYQPPQPVDWLLSDIVCEPARAIALVDDWQSRARNLVVTVKFKGRDQYGALSDLSPIFERARPQFARVKHLAHNKNEVTVMVRNSA